MKLAAITVGAMLLAMGACGQEASAPIDCPAESLVDVESGVTDIWFCSGSTALAGTIHRPGQVRASAIFVHGSAAGERLAPTNPVIVGLLDAGVAVLTYDKRGTGSSQGTCCPGNEGDFEELIADVAAAIRALRLLPDLGDHPVGIYGESQATWIAPAAAATEAVEFLVLTSAPPISFGEEILHEELTDDGVPQETIDEQLRNTAPSGADPRADISAVTAPMLWIYGAEDTVIPVGYSLEVLAELEADGELDMTVETIEGAGHSLIHDPGLFTLISAWLDGHLGSRSSEHPQ